MSDMSQTNLREPEQTDWENYGGSKWTAPPPATDASGKSITYYGRIQSMQEKESEYALDKEGKPFLNFLFDPIRLVKSGQYDGIELRFTEASVKPFEKDGKPMKGNPSKLGNLLRSAGLQVKPQSNADWRQAVKAAAQRDLAFTIDWRAKNKETGETINGYASFPADPERPGFRKAILKKGDVYNIVDQKGNVTGTAVVESEILFANPKVRYFVDTTPKTGK